MGAGHSTPPPLVEVSASGRRVLAPADTIPAYIPPIRNGQVSIYRSPKPHRPRQNLNFIPESSESESGLGMERYPPSGMRQGLRCRGRGAGMGFPGMGRRPCSTPEMLMMYPGMGMGTMGSPRMGGRRMGIPMGMSSPKMGGRGMGARMQGSRVSPMYTHGMHGPNGMHGIGGMGMPPTGMYPSDMPPEYSSTPYMHAMPTMPRYDDGRGTTPNIPQTPYAYPPAHAPIDSSGSPSTTSPQPQHRRPSQTPGFYENIPMAAYTAPAKPRRSHTEPPISTKLNRNRPTNKKVGPSGHEWVDGDAFLDACMCTTNCTCRKGHRVLYRANHNSWNDGSDVEKIHGSGEIRFILKEDLGRDCGDHEACKDKNRAKSSDEESEKRSKREMKREKQKFDRMKEEFLEAFDERFEEMNKCQEPPQDGRRPAAGFGGFDDQIPGLFMMGEEDLRRNIDPRMLQRRGMTMGTDPYGMNMGMTGMGKRAPPGMANPMNGMNMDMSNLSKPRPNMSPHDPTSARGGMKNMARPPPQYTNPPRSFRTKPNHTPSSEDSSVSDTSDTPNPYSSAGRTPFDFPCCQKPTPDHRGVTNMHQPQSAHRARLNAGFEFNPARRRMGRWEEDGEEEEKEEDGKNVGWGGMNRRRTVVPSSFSSSPPSAWSTSTSSPMGETPRHPSDTRRHKGKGKAKGKGKLTTTSKHCLKSTQKQPRVDTDEDDYAY